MNSLVYGERMSEFNGNPGEWTKFRITIEGKAIVLFGATDVLSKQRERNINLIGLHVGWNKKKASRKRIKMTHGSLLRDPSY